jgi:hypothetical protein
VHGALQTLLTRPHFARHLLKHTRQLTERIIPRCNIVQ